MISHGDRSLFVYRWGDLLRQHVVVTMAGTYYFMCAGEFLENLCPFNIILFPHQVTQILCDLNFFDMLQGPKFFCGDRFSQKFSSTLEVICCCNLSPGECTDL